MEQAVTSLGTPELHKKHSILIEGGQYPRSKVMDQCIFDRYLMNGDIALHHHRTAEFLLGLAAKANMWAKGANIDGIFVDGTKKSKVFFGMMPFGNALRLIRKELGNTHLYVTTCVIVDNKDVRKIDKGIDVFKNSMECVHDNMYSFHRNPLRHFK